MPSWVGLASLGLSIILALSTAIVVIWNGGRWAGKLESLATEVTKGMSEWKEDRKKLQQIDIHERDIEQLKQITSTHSSKIESLWMKSFSHDTHIAVTRQKVKSITNEADSDPPTKFDPK
jgi:hypothetical protein